MWRNGSLLKTLGPAGHHGRARLLRSLRTRVLTRQRMGWAWVPIRPLSSAHRPLIDAHLLALSPKDRYLRFGYAASDDQIRAYAQALNFDSDHLFGILDKDLNLIAMAHLAYEPAPQFPDRTPMVEFGVSVAASVRGRGYGSHLFDHAVLHARNCGTGQLFIHALSENTAMLHIATNAGAKVQRDGSESEAWLTLAQDTVLSQLGERIKVHAAAMHYQWARQRQGLHRLHRLAVKVWGALKPPPGP